eukprot:CAMPEP_0178596788 /NCGR_PEP_ID=MMETSP0697-20121206/31831_1 /TAXON_ID=265572 /ORGANISM="Extubocellulus spinifer, Strain CCMP396" /LENGTH=114 /DNA_ID=CAMNT_0020234383 /DNA_START=144 /DNA_END=488 /DNA_ORIENTATION=+
MYAANVDGIDPDSCRNVLIEHNDLSVGDDHVAIKSGRCGQTDAMSPNDCRSAEYINRNGPYVAQNITVRKAGPSEMLISMIISSAFAITATATIRAVVGDQHCTSKQLHSAAAS